MKTLTDAKKKNSSEGKRFTEAEKDLKALQQQIAPFVKPRRIRRESSAGTWIETSSLDIAESHS